MRYRTIATHIQMLYTFVVEYPFPPVGIVGAADGKNRRAFLCSLRSSAYSRVLCVKIALTAENAEIRRGPQSQPQ